MIFRARNAQTRKLPRALAIITIRRLFVSAFIVRLQKALENGVLTVRPEYHIHSLLLVFILQTEKKQEGGSVKESHDLSNDHLLHSVCFSWMTLKYRLYIKRIESITLCVCDFQSPRFCL